ncbi:hypothetical protein LUZ60_012252 [Juncus effusus]|nr:hypothetical protein LUZ60_012252 [Juncus effusus]
MCYMLSPRALSIVWGDTPQYWRWISLPDSRFSEVAELVNVYWLEIRSKIQRNLLSRKTTYAAYLIFKVNGNGRSFSFQPQETSVTATGHTNSRMVSLAPDRDSARRNSLMFRSFLSWRGVLTLPVVEHEFDRDDYFDSKNDEIGFPSLRRDGWMEIELGEFYNEGENNDENGEVEMSFMEVKGRHCKRGLIVQGIEIRPKY